MTKANKMKKYAAARKEQEALLLAELDPIEVKLRALLQEVTALLENVPTSEPCMGSLNNIVNISRTGFMIEFSRFKARLEPEE